MVQNGEAASREEGVELGQVSLQYDSRRLYCGGVYLRIAEDSSVVGVGRSAHSRKWVLMCDHLVHDYYG